MMFIEGIGISGYRSFGREVQRIGPFKKINLIIGRNNSGKSNVLRFLKDHYPNVAKGESPKLEALDRHIGETITEYRYEIALGIDGDLYQRLMKRLAQGCEGFQQVIDRIRTILGSDILTKGTGLAWFPYVVSGGKLVLDDRIFREFSDANIMPSNVWRNVWRGLTGQDGGGLLQHWIPQTLIKLSPLNLPMVNVSFIPAIREIVYAAEESDEKEISGKGLNLLLGKLERPRYDQLDLKEQFKNINLLLQTVTEEKTARIEIPSEQDVIQVSMNGRTLPLSSLGTGIHEVLILAFAATALQNQVLCMEEPEIHLHPSLQKQLLDYLSKNTSNQYFIATHSAHMLDTLDVAIFHIRLEEGKSVVDLVLTDSHKSRICDELGYRASDLLQANCIIWVEGPSDRIYLNHWIRSVAPKLIEGLHYSIMFYGGRLLSHLSADDSEVEDFISLRRLNRHIAVLIDSDKAGAGESINATKERVRAEFNEGPGFAWVTKGREIENYIDADVIDEAIQNVHTNVVAVPNRGDYDDRLVYKISGDRKQKQADKVKVANKVASGDADLDVLDLREQIQKIVEFIRESNGMDE